MRLRISEKLGPEYNYVWAMLWTALNAHCKILKWMRCFNKTQCSLYINGVMMNVGRNPQTLLQYLKHAETC